MMESLTMIPVRVNKPSIDIGPIAMPMMKCPSKAPVSPRGMAAITARGQVYDEKIQAKII